MKKIISLCLCALMLFPLCIGGRGKTVSAADATVSLTKFTTLATAGQDAAHGNHQTRTVHTSHGEYAAYITSNYTDSSGNAVCVYKVYRIDTAAGTKEVVFTGEKYYDSSQVSLLVDKYENVWAVTSTSDSRRNFTSEGLDLRAHKIDAETGEVTSYTRLTNTGGAQDGYGYGMSFYDPVNERIICVHAGGDYREGSTTGASLNWAFLDIKSGIWGRRVFTIGLEARHCYFYGFVDNNGGLMILGQRDIKAASIGYPEIGSNDGLTSADYTYMNQNGITRWAANYSWDALDLYYIPDIKVEKAYTYSVVEPDFSKVTGNQSYRNSLTGRLNNYYPANQNNNGGDFLWTQSADGKTLLHITYNSAYIQAAMDRSKGISSGWFHQVWDITDPTNAARLYDGPIMINGVAVDDVTFGHGFGFRLYQDTEGRVYLVCATPGAVTLYRIAYDDETGAYNYVKTGNSLNIGDNGTIISISSHRGGSITDNKFNIMYTSGGKYKIATASLSVPKYTPGDFNEDGQFTSTDLNKLLRYIAGAISGDFQNVADVNSDGIVNARDLNKLKKVVIGLDNL